MRKRILCVVTGALLIASLSACRENVEIQKDTTIEEAGRDTTPPEVVLKQDISVIVGQIISSDDVILTVEDESGIKSIQFKENTVAEAVATSEEEPEFDDSEIKEIAIEETIDTQERNLELDADKAYALYDETGVYENEIIVTDNHDNKTILPVTIRVVDDYIKHIHGFKDFVITQGEEIDWTAHLEWDEKIIEVEADDRLVNVNNSGEYSLMYRIAGDDGVTVLDKEIKVKVE